MSAITLTEEDRLVLLLLTSEQRDAVVLSLLTGERQELDDRAGEAYAAIMRRSKARAHGRERAKRYRNRYSNGDCNGYSDVTVTVAPAPSPSSSPCPPCPPSLPPTPPISPPYNPPVTPPPSSPSPRGSPAGGREAKPKTPKVQWAEFVAMSNAEHQKLLDTHGPADTARLIEILDNYKGSTGKKYKDDYRAILSWCVDRLKEEKGKRQATQTKQAQGGNPFLRRVKEMEGHG